MKDNIPDNSIVGNNICLTPEEATLKIWQKPVFNQFNFCFLRNIRPSLHWCDTRQNEKHPCTKKKYAYLNFWWDCSGIDCWIFIKKKVEAPLYIGSVTVANETTMKMSTWSERKERDVNDIVCSKWGKKLYIGINFAMYTCVKMNAILPIIINMKLLINCFIFWNSIDIFPTFFKNIVRLIWHTLKPRYIELTYTEFSHTSRISFAFKYH